MLTLSALSVIAIVSISGIGMAATAQLQRASAHASDIELAVGELVSTTNR